MSEGKNMEDKQTEHEEEVVSELCMKLIDQYSLKKTGISYETSFVCSVAGESGLIYRDMTQNPDMFREYGEESSIDHHRALLVAMLHDLGLTVCREGHNDISFGVVTGGLSVMDILKTPVFSDCLKEGHLSLQERDHLVMFADGRTKCSELTAEERIGLSVVLARCLRFHLGYEGSVPGGRSIDDADAEMIFAGFKDFFPYIDDEAIIRNATDSLFENGKLTVTANYPDLQDITNELHEIFTEDEIKTFANAVQDHIFTVNEAGEPYFYRNLYGKVLAESIRKLLERAQNAASILNKDFLEEGCFAD